MRFTSNAFIVSTIALLSLVTPVVNADVADITTPTAGQTLSIDDSITVKWAIADGQGLDGVNCDIVLVHDDGVPVPASPGILQSSVPILDGQSNGPVTIPDVTSGDNYFMQLVSPDQSAFYGQSGAFSIV